MSKFRFGLAVMLALISLVAGGILVSAQDEITETFVSADGTLTFAYPAGWFVEEDELPEPAWNFVMLFKGQNPNDVHDIESEQVGLFFNHPVLSVPLLPGIDSQFSLEDITLNLVETPEFDPDDLSVITLENYQVLQISAPDIGEDGDIFFFVVDLGDNYLIATALTPVGEFAQYQSIVHRILDTLVFRPLTGFLTFTAVDGELSFDYPAHWRVMPILGSGQVHVITRAFQVDDVARPTQVTIYTPFGVKHLIGMIPTSDPQIIIGQAYPHLFADDIELILGDMVDIEIGGYSVVRVAFTSATREGVFLAFDTGTGISLVAVSTPLGELAAIQADLQMLLESLRFE